jgi:hypothetical protein
MTGIPGDKDEEKELELKRLLLEQLNVASKEIGNLGNSIVIKNKKIIVGKNLPKSLLKKLKDLGYDIIELDTLEQGYESISARGRGKLRTAQITMEAKNPDPSLAVKNAEAAKALADKYMQPRQKPRNTPAQKTPDSWTKNLGDKLPAKNQNSLSALGRSAGGKQSGDEKSKGAADWIDNMSFSGNSAQCTIHYHSEGERKALEAQASAQMNSMLNEKSYVRKEANREAYPALFPSKERDGLSLEKKF